MYALKEGGKEGFFASEFLPVLHGLDIDAPYIYNEILRQKASDKAIISSCAIKRKISLHFASIFSKITPA